MMIRNSLMILIMLTFMGCAKGLKDTPKLDAMGKFFDCLGDSSKCEKLKNSVEE